MRSKLILIVVIIIVLLIPIYSYAESADEVSITFRGIPWGSSYNDIQDSLQDGQHLGKLSSDHYCSSAYGYVTAGYDILYSGEELGAFCSLIGSDGKYVPVAGYDTILSEMVFAYTPNDDGIIDYNSQNTALIQAMYSIETIVPHVVFDDLLAKLTSVYGEPVYEKRTTGSCPVWTDQDGGMVGLIIKSDDVVIIRYTFKGADQLITDAHSILVEMETRKTLDVQSDTSGL